jgi:methylated-DNA-[protein]-cysteine S-methyltransferase
MTTPPDSQRHARRVRSAVGWWTIEGTARTVHRVHLPTEVAPAVTKGPVTGALEKAIDQLAAYLQGERRRFSVPLEWSYGTDFQQDVWRALATIPFGTQWTYGELAAAVGRPKAARAVGQANGANPWPVLIPCHRVVASNHLGGYAGGLDVKRFLLALEENA